jgi:TolA-binding protein
MNMTSGALSASLVLAVALGACDRIEHHLEAHLDGDRLRPESPEASPDQKLYRAAYDLSVAGRNAEAAAAYRRLLVQYPESRFVPDTYLALAEAQFNAGQLAEALAHYKKVDRFPRAGVYGYALYKQGWCHLNLGQPTEAEAAFRRAADHARNQGPGRQNEDLLREAHKGMARAFADTGRPEQAWTTFSRSGGALAPVMMEELGERYWKQQNATASDIVYSELLRQQPDSPLVCRWQGRLVRAASGDRAKQAEQLRRQGAIWERLNTSKIIQPSLLEECRRSYRDGARELALLTHKQAQKTKSREAYELSDQLYREYLQRFQSEEGSYDMAFYYAEILWTRERWREAGEQYSKVVRMNPAGKYTVEAAYGAVLAWKNALADATPAEKRRDTDTGTRPRPLSEDERALVGAFDDYIRHGKDRAVLVKIKYRRARLHYEHNLLEEATRGFADLVDEPGDPEIALYSAGLLLDSMERLNRRDELAQWVTRLMDRPALMKDATFVRRIHDLQQRLQRRPGRNGP